MEKISCPQAGVVIEKDRCLASQMQENADALCGECRYYHKNTPTFRLAERLFNTEGVIGKPEYHLDGDYFVWRFHENLSITVSTVEMGLGYVEINEGMLNMHPYAEEMYQNIVEIARGNVVVVTKMGIAGRYAAGIYPIAYYQEKRKKVRFGIKTIAYTARGEIE